MNTKEKSKRGKGKAIMGIAMAAIMVASVFAAMIGSAGAYSTGGAYNIILNQTIPVQIVLMGQDLNFSTSTGWGSTPVSIMRVEEGDVKEAFSADAQNHFDTSIWTTTGSYYVNFVNATVYDASLAVSEATMSLDLRVGTKSVTRISKGATLVIDLSSSLLPEDIVDLVVTGPAGRMTNATEPYPQQFNDINVSYLMSTYGTGGGINTTDWKVGTYKFKIVTESARACGLDKSTAEKILTIGKAEIDIEAEKTSVAELEYVALTVTGVNGHLIGISVEADAGNVWFPGGLENNPINDTHGPFNDTMGASGTRKYVVYFTDTGSYTIRATDWTDDPAGATYKNEDITVTEKAVTFDLPMIVVIGEKLEIKGHANTGTTVDITIGKDRICLNDIVIDENGDFSEEIETGANAPLYAEGLKAPGSVRIKAYIDYPGIAGYTIPTTDDDDGSTAILMVTGDLTAEVSVSTVAHEDDFEITGYAKGSKRVDIITIAPKGGGGTGISPGGISGAPGMSLDSTSVSETDDSYTKKLTVNKDADTGTYIIAVLATGRDMQYGTCAAGLNLTACIDASGYGDLGTKTQEGVVAILEDLTTQAGSDDLFVLLRIKVESPKVLLNPVEDVAIGEPLDVTGITNREEGFVILVTVKGPVELKPASVKVENGTFSATFDTTEAVVGTYTVTADDGDGHTEAVDVELVEKVVPVATPEPTAKPTVAPVPTAEPTAEPTPTPTEEPGFEAVFAIAGLLSIAYLVLRRRK